MMGPGFFAAAFARDLFHIALLAFALGVVIGVTIVTIVNVFVV